MCSGEHVYKREQSPCIPHVKQTLNFKTLKKTHKNYVTYKFESECQENQEGIVSGASKQ